MALSLSLVIKLLFVASFAGWAVYVHYRGEARLSFSRQLSDHSTLFAPLNWLIYTFSAVPNRPILDLADFPQLQPLMNNWQIIRDEAVQLQEQGAVRASPLEHAIVRPDDLTRVNVAFFQVTVGISMGLLAVGLADLLF